jgi:spore maturation protein CgeB
LKLLYHAQLWAGSTALQRFEAFRETPGVTAVAHCVGAGLSARLSPIARIRWKLRCPMDVDSENENLVNAVATEMPDVVFVDNSRVITRGTLRKIRRLCDPLLVYYSPDDIIAAHNLSWTTRLTFSEWDVFFTTKTFNVPELRQCGVRNPVLIGNAFDPDIHRPMTRQEVGEEYEHFDLVFMGTFENERRNTINRLAQAGFRIVVYSGNLGAWKAGMMHPSVTMREARYGLQYCAGMHSGKIALCFLRKINRDRITTRSIECTSMGRPMVAEKTVEHDQHFRDGIEYVGFVSEADLVAKVRQLLADDFYRRSLGKEARARCLASGYSTRERALEMVRTIQQCG